MAPSSPDPASDAPAGASVPLPLEQAISRARWAIAWERLWPHLARILTLAGVFLFASWAGLWLVMPFVARAAGLILFAVAGLATLVPLARMRWPGRDDALRRLDHGTGLKHRPATALGDTQASADPVAQALWEAQRARTLASVKELRAGLPSPRLARHDPWALRALVSVSVVAAFMAAGGERWPRIVAAFDWNGVLAATETRVDAWVTPPPYTGRPPVILTAAAQRETPPSDVQATIVPVGSILVVRSSGTKLDVAMSGGIAEAPPPADVGAGSPPQTVKGATERRFLISGDGTAHVRVPTGQPQWTFRTTPDRAPTIALAKEPERQARGSLLLSYKLDDDYGVIDARANFAARKSDSNAPDANAQPDANAARPLYDLPQVQLALPNARTRAGVGQTVKDLSEHPFAGADMMLTLTARDEAGNEGRSEPSNVKLPERLFAKPLPRALIEQRRVLAFDAGARSDVTLALEALSTAPELFMPELGQYLGLRSVASQLTGARNDEHLREVVDSLWALAVAIEDGDISDVEKALRAAQEALKQALERGASDEEIKKLTEQLRAALDNYMRQLAEQMRTNPQQLARPLDPNARTMRPQDLNNMIDRMERLARSGDKDGAKAMLEQLQRMLENLQMARPGQGGDGEDQQALNELGDVIRKQQQLRDKTFKEGQDSRRDRRRGEKGDQNAMNELRQDQQGLRDRLNKLLEELNKRGMGQGQRADKGQKGQQGQGQPGQGQQGQRGQPGQGQPGQGGEDGEDGLGDAESAMGDADGRLGEGNADGAVDSQGRALQALRRGAQKLAQAMQQQQGDGPGDDNGPGERMGRQQSSGANADPLGRPLRGREFGDDLTVKIPGEIDVQRVRRILEELRRRLGDSLRPQLELDYIERLLKDY